MIGPALDFSTAELRDFRVQSGELTQRLELSDGAVLEVKLMVNGLFFLGRDPNNGMPIYGMNASPAWRVVKLPDGMTLGPTAKPPGTSPPGFG